MDNSRSIKTGGSGGKPAETSSSNGNVKSLVEREVLRQKRIERFTLAGAFVFVVSVVLLVVFYQGPVASGASKVMRYVGITGGSSESTNVVQVCKDPKNARTPYCQERKSFEESTWKSITRYGENPASFSLHED